MIPLISFDAVVNVYLTIIFLIPLNSKSHDQSVPVYIQADERMDLYSFKNMARSPANHRLRSVAFRTFVGAVCTLVSSITYVPCNLLYTNLKANRTRNLSVLMALNGEPGWVCLMCCNCDSQSPQP